MGKVTGLVKGKGRDKKIKIYLDGEHARTLLADVVLKEGIRTGQEISAAQMETLSGKDRRQRCLNAAVRYLGYRPRSEAEMAQRLRQHGFDAESIKKTVSDLKKQGLIDDAAFARFWIENREIFRPRSRRLAGAELRRKGLSADLIERVTRAMDDGESAYRAAVNRARRLSAAEYSDFRRRLGSFLGRRGYSYDVINETVAKVWRESGTG